MRLGDGFWRDRQVRNREVTIPHGIEMLEEWGSLNNLRMAAGESSGEYRLPVFMDSDVYKVMEAVAWERQHGLEPAHERFFEQTAALLSKAQEPEGYLNSYVQVVQPGKRFAEPAMGHELYCAGHLFQAAVAEARGPRREALLGPIALRLARHLVGAMRERPGFVPGHPEVEMALVEMYRQNGGPELLDLAAELAGRRGRSTLTSGGFGPEYFQDEMELAKADKVRGHAVRALYLLSGAADLFVETGRPELLEACQAQWDDMVSSKAYLTGGVGSRHKDEAFGDPYELPPDRAYCETCAAVASVMWNWRMTLATGQARYAELTERTLYNGFLAGWGLDAKSFFYVNPLQSRTGVSRQRWYRCACCPPNVMRLVASLEHYVASRSAHGLQLHQFVPATISLALSGGRFRADVDSAYPWEGWLRLRVEEAPEAPMEIAVRVPSWAPELAAEVNGSSEQVGPGPDGYLHLRRSWRPGDELGISFPLRPRLVRPDPRIDALRRCVAVERGPLVYCFEPPGPEAAPGLREQAPDALAGLLGAPPITERSALVGGEKVIELVGQGRAFSLPGGRRWPYYDAAGSGRGAGTHPNAPTGGGPSRESSFEMAAIPYFAWANRGELPMRVWVPEIAL
ncbi:MAG: glycoside hydrolase family 127 protein [Actinomycetota bacterium]|nr:glycoside hydrolase family 127 protein [Actinomycetota bacterium]